MSATTEMGTPSLPEEVGIRHEFVLLSVCVSHNRPMGQFDDSCAHLIEKHLREYQGILNVKADVHYKHCKEEVHWLGCQCHFCTLALETSVP